MPLSDDKDSDVATEATTPLSLPDQLPIKEETSFTEEEPLRAIPPKIFLKERKSSKLKKILKEKHPVSRRYFTAGMEVKEDELPELEKQDSPFQCPKDIEEFAHKVLTSAWRHDQCIKELQEKIFNKPNFRLRQQKNLLSRLYVKKPKVISGKSVLNLDPDYFATVGGRPIADYRVSIRDYVEILRDSLRTRVVIGYRKDDIMLIDETLRLEQKIIDGITGNLNTYINTFEDFLIADHKTAMRLLEECERLGTISYTKYAEYLAIVKKYSFLRSSVFLVEEKWKTCKTYQRFLYSVSPMTWKLAIQDTHGKKRNTAYMMEQENSDIFGYQHSSVEGNVSLSDIINEFKEEIEHGLPAQLYFTNPEELLDVFRFIEVQNLNALLYSEEISVPLANMKENMDNALKAFDYEIKLLQEIIDKLDKGILWEEERALNLEEFSDHLIKNELKDLVMSENILDLHIFIEDIYEYCIGSNDANIKMGQMMSAIEGKYRAELLSLDKVPSGEVALLEGNYYQEEMKVMKLAERAAKQYADLEKITVQLNKSFAPPPPRRNKRVPLRRCSPIRPPVRKEEPPHDLTPQEEEFLEFFTDYCPYTDNIMDYEIQIDDTEIENFRVSTKVMTTKLRKNV